MFVAKYTYTVQRRKIASTKRHKNARITLQCLLSDAEGISIPVPHWSDVAYTALFCSYYCNSRGQQQDKFRVDINKYMYKYLQSIQGGKEKLLFLGNMSVYCILASIVYIT